MSKRELNEIKKRCNAYLDFRKSNNRRYIKLKRKIEEDLINKGMQRVAIYGGGEHTINFLEKLKFGRVKAEIIFDSNSKKHNKILQGLKVSKFNENLTYDGIIISSYASEMKIYEDLLKKYKGYIYRLYYENIEEEIYLYCLLHYDINNKKFNYD